MITADRMNISLELKKGEVVKETIILTNTSDQHVYLTPWSTCGCTTPTVDPQVIPPNGTSKLVVTYNTKNKGNKDAQRFGVNYKLGTTAYGLTMTLLAKIN